MTTSTRSKARARVHTERYSHAHSEQLLATALIARVRVLESHSLCVRRKRVQDGSSLGEVGESDRCARESGVRSQDIERPIS